MRIRLLEIALRRLVSMCLVGIVIFPASALAEFDFGVRDDIGITQFGDIYRSPREDVIVSPAGQFVVVHTVGFSLAQGTIHDQLRFYNIENLRRFVLNPSFSTACDPLWTVEESSNIAFADTPLVTQIRWLRDETGVGFLLRTDESHNQLLLARIADKRVETLSPDRNDILSFSIVDGSHYVFTSATSARVAAGNEAVAPAVQVGTGRSLDELLFPREVAENVERAEIWAVRNGPAQRIDNQSSHRPIVLYGDGIRDLVLSPDGKRVVTVSPIADIPKEWEGLYPPPFPEAAYRVRAGHQDLTAPSGWTYLGKYIRIELETGRVTDLTGAPAALRAGWTESIASPAWSDDSSSIILPGTFLAEGPQTDLRPCVVVLDVVSGASECVRPLRREHADGQEQGYERIDDISFVPGHKDALRMGHFDRVRGGERWTQYARQSPGAWTSRTQAVDKQGGFDVKVQADFKTPPVLVATDTSSGMSRVIFDPNPQLKTIAMGEPELYSWRDSDGRSWESILYKPVGFRKGVKYPLVIQNHGFSVDRFTPSGGFPSAFIAQELAASGIMVLQMRDCAGRDTPLEGPCNVKGYETAISKLTSDSLIDPDRVGIIGFSRTVFYTLEALTTSTIHFRAASITDGFTLGYLDYLSMIGPNSAGKNEAEAMIGAAPIGIGLERWLKLSPVFNMDRVSTPLRIVATRHSSILEMWEPYALLEEAHHPVDLILLNTSEHIFTNPSIRLVAQEGNLDWFRFWLQGWEDPDPSKQPQYARWRSLRDAMHR